MGVPLLKIGRCCYNGFESQSLTTNFPFPSYCKTRVAVAKQLEQSRTNASWTKKSWKESFSVDGVMALILNLCSQVTTVQFLHFKRTDLKRKRRPNANQTNLKTVFFSSSSFNEPEEQLPSHRLNLVLFRLKPEKIDPSSFYRKNIKD